jgi:hypothetical protein
LKPALSHLEKFNYFDTTEFFSMRRLLLFLFLPLPFTANSQSLIDSCFASPTPGTTFQGTSTLADVTDADLVEWNGTSWIGAWSNAQVNLPPPCPSSTTRAIWMGDQTLWTSGGEGFAAKLTQPLVTGTVYTFTFTYVSDGLYSNGNFSPYFRTNSNTNFGSAHAVGQLTPAGNSWETHDVTFTATAAQGGDNWVFIHSNNGSGMVLSQCAFTAIDLGNDTTICEGDTLFLSAPSQFNSYVWNTGDTSSSLAVTTAGTYYVAATLSSCTATDSVTIDFIPCFVPQPGFSSTDTAVCEKFCVDFVDISTNTPFAWQWLFPGGSPSSSTLQNPTGICYSTSGLFDVTLITTSTTGNDTLTLNDYITVFATPPFPVITLIGTTLTSTPAASYQWQLNSVDISGATNQSYEVSQSGYYSVIITDENGCISSTSLNVIIEGIETISETGNVSVYPNPASGNFFIEWHGAHGNSATITILNALGQKVYTTENSTSAGNFKKEITAGELPAGCYIVEIQQSDYLFSHKLVITK